MLIIHNEKEIEYTIIYKKRKTFGIYIDVFGNIEVRVPKEATEIQVMKMVEEKIEWVIKKSEEMKDKSKGYQKKEYVQGERFLYLGKEYPIQILVTESLNQNNTIFVEGILKVYVRSHEEEQIQEALKRFYYQECKALLDRRIRYYQNQIKVKSKSFRLTNNKSNWGTCNSKKELTFNWKLIMAPMEVLDYVVVHELCHMVHMNHDRSFWRLVGKHFPNYEECQKWLAQSNWKMVL